MKPIINVISLAGMLLIFALVTKLVNAERRVALMEGEMKVYKSYSEDHSAELPPTAPTGDDKW